MTWYSWAFRYDLSAVKFFFIRRFYFDLIILVIFIVSLKGNSAFFLWCESDDYCFWAIIWMNFCIFFLYLTHLQKLLNILQIWVFRKIRQFCIKIRNFRLRIYIYRFWYLHQAFIIICIYYSIFGLYRFCYFFI